MKTLFGTGCREWRVKQLANQWTNEQQAAITGRGGNLLVAAAAGSGKTAVLVERIIRRLTDGKDPVDADRLLVVTFTNAAAAEMRERIGRSLAAEIEKNPAAEHLHRQMALFSRAAISTIHSFCQDLLRRYFYRLDLDPSFRVADETECALIRAEAMEELFERRYNADDNHLFTVLVDCYGGKRDDSLLQEMVLSAYNFARSTVDPIGWLQELPAAYNLGEDQVFDQLPWCEILKKSLENELAVIISALEQAIGLALKTDGPGVYLPNLEEEQEIFSSLLQRCTQGISWSELYGLFQGVAFARLPACRKKDADPELVEQVKKLRDRAKEKAAAICRSYFDTPPERICHDLSRLYPLVQELAELTIDFAMAYEGAKRARNVVDFGDLEQYSLQVLSERGPEGLLPSAVAMNLQERYEEVLVDEYQDINAMQEAILQLVSRPENGIPNLFMVGDVKQSIYRFRLADPGLFLQKYMAYSTGLKGRRRRIDLARNFRSRQGLVNAVNFVFRQLMTPSVGEIDYGPDAELVYGADYPPPGGAEQIPDEVVEVHLIEKGPTAHREQKAANKGAGQTEQAAPVEFEEGLEAMQKEARLIAARIKELVGLSAEQDALHIYDRGLKQYRPLTYRDVVVLLRATSGHANTFVEEFRLFDIPVYAELATGYFQATEIETILSLLKIIDNPLQDVPLAAVLRSPLVGLDAGELARIRLHSRRGSYFHAVVAAGKAGEDELSPKLIDFLRKLEKWRTAARRGSLADLIWSIYRETGYYDFAGGLPGGGQRQANLRSLYNRARQYEAGSFRGLFLFLRFIEQLLDRGGDLGPARALGEKENVVRVMSIHKSKGLEFPVVFVAGLGKEFNFRDLSKDILFHKDLGLGLQLVDVGARLTYPAMSKLALKQKLKLEALAEEMRILYVAMTRAREKLVLVGSVDSLANYARRWCMPAGTTGWRLPDGYLADAQTYLDWLGAALARHRDGVVIRQAGLFMEKMFAPAQGDSSRWQIDLDTGLKGTIMERAAVPEILELIKRQETPADPGVYTDVINDRLNWCYPAAATGGLPTRFSVTELQKRLDPAPIMEDGAGQDYQRKIGGRPFFTPGERKLTALEKGSALHLVMKNIDLGGPLAPGDIEKEIADLVRREILTAAQAAAVPVEKIAVFFAGPLGKRMLAGREVLRELPFTLALPAREIYPYLADNTEEKVIVQGVVDCLVDEGDGYLLLDYKTDKPAAGGAAGVVERYRGQLTLYARAAEEILARPVKEKQIYLFSLDLALKCI
ncbi:MAG: helicase-exonuclease AddAB subunit AddA [Peptococcaceae bacterium]|nr:helicase-exonuclease AddAB subunit AddA [Candidatus Syntrophopropionicum ammoniitolerans]